MMHEGDKYGWTKTDATSCEEAAYLPLPSSSVESYKSVAKAVPFYAVPSSGFIEEDSTDLFNLFSSFQDAASVSTVESVNANKATVRVAHASEVETSASATSSVRSPCTRSTLF